MKSLLNSLKVAAAVFCLTLVVSFSLGVGVGFVDSGQRAADDLKGLFAELSESLSPLPKSAQAAATIHIPDAFLASAVQGGMNLGTDTVKCGLIDISSYSQSADVYLADVTQVAATGGYTAGGQTVTSIVVAADTTNHWTTITITPAVWSGSTTISATGAVCYDSTASNRIIAVDDFGATVASSGGTYTVGAIVLKFTHF